MTAFIALPLHISLAVMAIVGFGAGSLVNAGIYALAWRPRPISPWQRRHSKAPPRRWRDFVPVFGWRGLAREAKVHGRGFWVRPVLIEICCGIGLPALYWWESTSHLAPVLPIIGLLPAPPLMLHQQFVSHAILIALMLVATFIDFDEKTIPDEITIPGTLIGLVLVAIWPDSHLPVVRPVILPVLAYQPLLMTSTSGWPAWLNDVGGLLVGITIFVAWSLALIPALATLRRGWWNGVRYYLASVARESAWWKMLLLAGLGSVAIASVWRSDGPAWQGLLSSLVGLGFGGGLIWAVRIIGRVALHKEAMGFGDVTLMAMIGSFLGWQACVIIFFLSPFAAIVFAVVQWILSGRRDIPYGPYLCAVALVLMIQWPWFWATFSGYFTIGWLLPTIIAVCGVLLMGLLMLWRLIERGFFPSD
ncbi:MAG: prepilin peptidase [Planctomycetia bacterium]|nr:prepilin peptidase [Planctomycetia bacterium]